MFGSTRTRGLALLAVGLACGDRTLPEEDRPELPLDPACPDLKEAVLSLATRQIRGQVQVTGAPLDVVALTLHGRDDGGTVEIETDAEGRYEVGILRERYDVIWNYGLGDGVPTNWRARLLEDVALGEGDVFDIAVPRVQVSGELLFDGAVGHCWFSVDPPAIFLEDAAGSRAGLDADWEQGTYADFVLPGVYDLGYDYHVVTELTHDAPAPASCDQTDDYWGVLLRGIDLTQSRTLDVDVPVSDVELQPTGTLADVLFPGELQRVDGRGRSSFGWYGPMARVIPGQYTLRLWEYGAVTGTLNLTADGPVEVRIDGVELRVRLSETGPAPPRAEPPVLYLQHDGPPFELPLAEDGSYVGLVPPGHYQLSARHDLAHTVVLTSHVDASTSREIESAIEWIEVDVELDLKPSSTSPLALIAVPEVGGDAWSLATTAGQTRAVLPRGTYRVQFYQERGPLTADSGATLSGPLALEQGQRLGFEVVVRAVELPYLVLDGRDATPREREALSLRRRSEPTRPQFDGGSIDPGGDGYQLITGTYDVFWSGADDHPAHNQDARVGCFNLH